MFAPTATGAAGTDLAHCIRILPTLGDEFGGFFVAVLRKRLASGAACAASAVHAPLASADSTATVAVTKASTSTNATAPAERVFPAPPVALCDEIAHFFGLYHWSEVAAQSSNATTATCLDVRSL
eukprot:5304943-Prymnesium_polylepis.1